MQTNHYYYEGIITLNYISGYNRLIGLVGRVFANGPGDLGSIPGRIIPKTLKIVLDTSLLNTQQYKICIKGKVEKSRERNITLPTPWCRSYCKGNLLVALDYSCQLLSIQKEYLKLNKPLLCRNNNNNGMLLAQISLTLSPDSSLLSIAFGWSSMLHHVSVQSYCR